MSKKYWIIILIFATVATLFTYGIFARNKSVPQQVQSSVQPPKPASITLEELKKLRWIEGTWRGTGVDQSPFFERYKFENDSTLLTESFADETLAKVTEVTRYELKDGQFGNGGEGSRWVLTHLDDESAKFEPVAKARNSFVFQRESKDKWKATLTWPANGDKPAGERVYYMERWNPAKK